MLLKFTCWSFAFYLLLLAIVSHDVNGMQQAEEIDHVQDGNNHIHMHSTHHMDKSVIVFFTPYDLKVGKVLPIYFRATNPSSSPKFLPREEAELLPFSLSKLPILLQHFGFAQGSSQARAMHDTLRDCAVPPIEGETKMCATSLESMLDFVQDILGSKTQFKVLSTKHHVKLANILQNYTIVEKPREIPAPKMVACHTMPYPYVIYYCHYQESESKVFQVLLQGENASNDVVEAVAVCHMDTSLWSKNHISFQVLGIEAGSSPVCHFFPADNLVWVPLTNSNESSEVRVAQI